MLKNQSFCIYGLGKTGLSVVNCFNKKKFTRYHYWDDNFYRRTLNGFKIKKSDPDEKKIFSKYLDTFDHIVLSPGISLKKALLKKKTYRE